MALGVIAEHTWHGNPRPIETYSYTLSDPAVTNPVTGYKHLVTLNTDVPLTTLAPGANILVAGPDLVVSADVTGVWVPDSALNIAITVTGGTDINTQLVNTTPNTLSSSDVAGRIANQLNVIGAGEILAGASANVVTISALTGVTALTITTWAVAV